MNGRTPEPTDPGIPLASGSHVRTHLRALLTGQAREVGVAVALVVVRALATFAPPIAVGNLVDILATGAGWSRTLPILVALTFAVAAGAVADRARIVRVAALGEQLLAELRTQLHATVLDWRAGEVESRRGRLLSVVTSDVGALAHAVRSALPDAVEIVVLLVVAAVVLPSLSVVLAGVLLAGLLPIAFVGRWFAPRSTRAYADLRAAQADVVDRMQTALSALDTSRSLGIASTQDRALATTHDTLLEHELRAMRLRNILLPSVALARGVTVAAVLGVGGALALTGRLPIGNVVAFALALRVVFQPVAHLSVLADLVLSSQAALARIVGVITAQHPRLQVPNKPVPMPPAAQLQMGGVSHAYPHGKDVLHDIDLHVPAGRSLALVGPSGAGKSTILQLLARLDDPRRGRVLLDSADVRSLDPRQLRRRVLLVTQDIALPTVTVAETVAGHLPAGRRSATCSRALRTIGLDLPLDARVDTLDDARRQQVVLARVVASDPDVVLLDEATAALDPDEARAVDAALGRTLAGRTLVVIAHRPATALACDLVAVIRDGRIVDTGPPAEVAARDAWRRSFANVTPAKLSPNGVPDRESGVHGNQHPMARRRSALDG